MNFWLMLIIKKKKKKDERSKKMLNAKLEHHVAGSHTLPHEVFRLSAYIYIYRLMIKRNTLVCIKYKGN